MSNEKVNESHIQQIIAGNLDVWIFVEEAFEAGLRSRASQFLRGSHLVKRVSVDDLVQETWLKAWNKRATFRGTSVPEFVKWLLTILKNTYIDKHRKSPFELSEPTILNNVIGPTVTPSETFRLQERDSSLKAMLARLDRLTREIITLKHFEGLTFRENRFFTYMEVPPHINHTQHYDYFQCPENENVVMVWGRSWIHPVGAPLDKPMELTQRIEIKNGKVCGFENRYDAIAVPSATSNRVNYQPPVSSTLTIS